MSVTTVESSFTFSDGLEVYAQTWKVEEQPPKAYAFFLHGFSDHCNAYYNFFPTLASRGIEVFAFDQRGWGRTCKSKAQRGNTGPNSQILKDIDELLLPRLELAASTGTPTFLLGHSNGGGLALWYACYGNYRQRLAGIVLESPFIALAPKSRPSSFIVTAGRLASKILPTFQLVQKLDSKSMSRDEEVCKSFDNDELCHDTATLIQLSDMLSRAKSLMKEEVYSLLLEDVPILVTHGTGDKVTCCETSEKFTELIKVKDKTFKSYDGWYHKLHAELNKLTYANDVADWILERAEKQEESEEQQVPEFSSAEAMESETALENENRGKKPEVESKL